jgi:predicted PurR-regulated permease PerM
MSGCQQTDKDQGGQSGLGLNPLQRRLVTTALAGISLFVICGLLYFVFRVLAAFVSGFSGIIMPLAVAGILAMLLRPVVQMLTGHTRLTRTGATLVLYMMVLLGVLVVLWYVVPVILEQSIAFIRTLPTIYAGLQGLIHSRFPQLLDILTAVLGAQQVDTLGSQVQALITQLSHGLLAKLAEDGGSYFAIATGWVTSIAIIPVLLFFFLRCTPLNRADIERQLDWMNADLRADLLLLGHHFGISMQAFFQGQILVGCIMGILLATGFSIVGVSFGFAIGAMIGILNIVPYLGTIIGLAVVLPVAWFQPEGGLALASTALAIFLVVQLIEGYLLTPQIMGSRTGLHPLTIIIAIFFWGIALDGILGMILAIPLTAFFVVVWQVLREKYLKKWSAAAG